MIINSKTNRLQPLSDSFSSYIPLQKLAKLPGDLIFTQFLDSKFHTNLLLNVFNFIVMITRRTVHPKNDQIPYVIEEIIQERDGQQKEAHENPSIIDKNHFQKWFAFIFHHFATIAWTLPPKKMGVNTKKNENTVNNSRSSRVELHIQPVRIANDH